MNRLVRLTVLTTMSAALAGGFGACGVGGDVQYEDCEVNDQYVNGDSSASQLYEPDCGYWTRAGSHFLHNGFLGDATWTYWSWVVLGQNSYHPDGWKPPHGLKPPLESEDSKKRRKQHEKKAPANTKPASKKPASTSGGDQRVTKNDSGTTTKKTTPRKKP